MYKCYLIICLIKMFWVLVWSRFGWNMVQSLSLRHIGFVVYWKPTEKNSPCQLIWIRPDLYWIRPGTNVVFCDITLVIWKADHWLIGLLLDLSKAFDTFNHALVVGELNFYIIDGVVLEWFTGISYRSHCVSNNSTKL